MLDAAWVRVLVALSVLALLAIAWWRSERRRRRDLARWRVRRRLRRS